MDGKPGIAIQAMTSAKRLFSDMPKPSSLCPLIAKTGHSDPASATWRLQPYRPFPPSVYQLQLLGANCHPICHPTRRDQSTQKKTRQATRALKSLILKTLTYEKGRGGIGAEGFQDRSLQPLGHPSGCGGLDTILPLRNAEGLSCAAFPSWRRLRACGRRLLRFP